MTGALVALSDYEVSELEINTEGDKQEIKTCSNKQTLREFVASRNCLARNIQMISSKRRYRSKTWIYIKNFRDG